MSPSPPSLSSGLRQGPRLADLLAGLTVAGVLLPEAVAYAGIAGVPPQHALVAALIGLGLYPGLGSSRYAIVAPTSAAAAVFASTAASGGPALGYALVGLTGLLLLVAGWMRAGFVGAFISRPVLRGFAWALALTIVVRQLPQVLGVPGQGETLPGPLAGVLWAQRAHWHLPSLLAGAAALALWWGLRRPAGRRVLLPASLGVLVLGVLASVVLDLPAHGVAMAPPLHGAPSGWTLPRLSAEHWLRAAELAPALLLILFAESWGAVRSLALPNNEPVDADRELRALGWANLGSALAQGLPVGAGFSAAAANQAAGARSAWAGWCAALCLLAALAWAQPAFAWLPLPVLAAVVIGILSHNLWPKPLLAGRRWGRDSALAWVAAAGVLLLGVLHGMLLAVGLSLLLALRRFAQPLLTELGQLPGTRDYLDLGRHPEARAEPGILVVRPEEPLFFANADQTLRQVRSRAEQTGARVVVLSLEVCDDLDSTAVEALAECMDSLHQRGVPVLLARVKDRPRDSLAHAGLDAAHPHRLYWSVDDAMRAAQRWHGDAAVTLS